MNSRAPAPRILDLLARGPAAATSWTAWFAELAASLLCDHTLRVAGSDHELCEIEFYLDAEGHRDPFTHGAEQQGVSGRWYFHRVGASYRGGSFKGLDLSFGPAGARGGILIRSLRTPSGAVINGSSSCVEHMLAQAGAASVAELDGRIDGRPVDAADSPLALIPRGAGSQRATIYTSARVGLTLKRAANAPTMIDYIGRRYRSCTQLRPINKGRPQQVVALHEDGLDVGQIRALTGSPSRSIEGWIAAYEDGRARASADEFIGEGLSSRQLCRLLGALARTRARARALAKPASA